MKHSNNKGFTLMELIVTIAIVGILSSIAILNMIGWRAERSLRGAINNLQNDIQLARMRAIREAEVVAVTFDPGTRSYRIWIDANSNWIIDAGEQELRNVILPVGVNIQTVTFSSNRTRFNAKGMPSVIGTVTIRNNAGNDLSLAVNRVGRLQVL